MATNFTTSSVTNIPDVVGLTRLQQILVQSKIQQTNQPLYQTIQGLIKQAQEQITIVQGNVKKIDEKIITGGAGITELTGDVVAGPGNGSQVATISAKAVTYAKIQDISAASRLLGRGSAAGAGSTQEITLDASLTMTGTVLSATSGGSGINQLTGDVTAGPGSGSQAATIAANAVTNAKLATIATQLLKGRDTAGTGNVEDITITQALKWLAFTSWTPALKFGGASTALTYTTQTGHYIRLGRIIAIFGRLLLSAKGSSTGNATITGLPFAVDTEAGIFLVPLYANMASLVDFTMSAPTGGTTINLYTSGATASAQLQDTNFTNTSDFTFGGIFQTADA